MKITGFLNPTTVMNFIGSIKEILKY